MERAEKTGVRVKRKKAEMKAVRSKTGRAEKAAAHIRGILQKILILCCVCMVLTGVYITADMIHVYQHSMNQVGYVKPSDINGETLTDAISGDAVAWITLDGTRIDYPVMQSGNNTDYLNKDPTGNYSLAGSIFLDYNCPPDFSARYSLVYGHHMANKLMFGALDDYENADFAKKHESGTLYTVKGPQTVRVVAYLFTKADCDEIFCCDTDTDYGIYLAQHGEYFFPQNMTDRLVALTTCRDPATTDRAALILAIQEN